jgi:lactoylglutathione lyase
MHTPILELRVAVTTEDYQRLVSFYQHGLGVDPAALWESDGGHATLFELGNGTLEVFDEAHAAAVDRIETGARNSGHIRFALRVPDLDAALARLREWGATVVHEPVVTPWNDRNARVISPDGLQVTLFQVMG